MSRRWIVSIARASGHPEDPCYPARRAILDAFEAAGRVPDPIVVDMGGTWSFFLNQSAPDQGKRNRAEFWVDEDGAVRLHLSPPLVPGMRGEAAFAGCTTEAVALEGIPAAMARAIAFIEAPLPPESPPPLA